MGIKTREFTREMGYRHDIDDLINAFLLSGRVDELIDIKYQTIPIAVGATTIVRTSALVIYKEEE